MKETQIRPTGVQFPLIYQAPIDSEMDDFIKRAAWEMGKKEGKKISLAEWGRRRMLPSNWRSLLAEWRKTQNDFDPNEFAGRKRLEAVNGHAKASHRPNSAVSKRAAQR